MNQRTVAGTLAVAIASVTLSVAAVQPAQAKSEDAWRIGTYLGGAGAAYGLAKGNSTVGLLGAGVGLLSYTQWKKEMSRRHRRERGWGSYRAYRSAWYRHHHHRYYRHHR